MSSVVFRARRLRIQIAGQPLSIEAPLKHLRISDRTVGAAGIGHAMDSKSGLIKIAFKYDSSSIDELLVVGIVRHRVLIKASQRAQWLQIEVDDAVGFWKKAGDFRRRLFTKVDGCDQRGQKGQRNRQTHPGASTHGKARTSSAECGEDGCGNQGYDFGHLNQSLKLRRAMISALREKHVREHSPHEGRNVIPRIA